MSDTAENAVIFALIWLLFVAGIWLDRRETRKERP